MFSQKSPQKFQTLAHQISLLLGLHTLNNPFLQKQKAPYSTTQSFFTLF